MKIDTANNNIKPPMIVFKGGTSLITNHAQAVPKILSIKKTFEKNTALIITWGGLRGGLSIALALNLPESIGTGKDLILILSYGVVLFTILVQGLTLKKIIK